MSREHGGDIVEAIAPEELVSFNDADCQHERLLRDEDDGDYLTFICANPNCNEVVLFNKEA